MTDPRSQSPRGTEPRREPRARTVAEAMETLRRVHHDPPEDLVDRAVLRAVRARAEAREKRRAANEALFFRRALIGAIGLLGATVAVIAWEGSNIQLDASRALVAMSSGQAETRPATSTSSTSANLVADDSEPDTAEAPSTVTNSVPVRFVLPAEGAGVVAVAGDFNGWDASSTPLHDDDGDGIFHGTVDLPSGAYAYMFVVDGDEWVTDPFADAFRDDGFGGRNAVVRIP